MYFDLSSIVDNRSLAAGCCKLLSHQVHKMPERFLFGSYYKGCDMKYHMDFIDDLDISDIDREILEALPEWFEIPESRISYAKESRKFPFFVDVENNITRGFIVMKETSNYAVEICVMGVRKEYQRLGIGSKLFEAFYQYAKEKGYEFVQVKTVRKGMKSFKGK